MSLKLGFLSDEGDTDAGFGMSTGMGTVCGRGTGIVLGRVPGMGTSDSTGTVSGTGSGTVSGRVIELGVIGL